MTVGANLTGCTISQVHKVYEPAAATAEPSIECPECARHGHVQLLRFHHISLHEAVQKCGAPRCMYPFRGFRYRDTSDAQLRVYRYERVQPAQQPHTTSTVVTTNGTAANQKVTDDEDVVPELPDLSEHFGDDAVRQPETNTTSCIPANHVGDCDGDATTVKFEQPYVDQDQAEQHQFALSWLDELAEQVAKDNGVPLNDFAGDRKDTIASYDQDLGMTANDSFLDQLDIDEILAGICNLSQKFDESLDDAAIIEQTIQVPSTPPVDETDGFYDVATDKPIPVLESTVQLAPERPPSPPKLSKCFANLVLPKKPRRRRPKEGSVSRQRSAKASCSDRFNFKIINSPQSDGGESVSSVSSRHSNVSAASTVRSASTASSSYGSSLNQLEDIIAIKDQLKPMDLISSLSKLDLSKLSSLKTAPALQPKWKTSKCKPMKIEFSQLSTKNKSCSIRSSSQTYPKRKTTTDNNGNNQFNIQFLNSKDNNPTGPSGENCVKSKVTKSSEQSLYPSIGDVVTIDAQPNASMVADTLNDEPTEMPAICFVVNVLPSDGSSFKYDLMASTVPIVEMQSNDSITWNLDELPMDTDANTVDAVNVNEIGVINGTVAVLESHPLPAESIASTEPECDDSEPDFLGFTRREVLYGRGKRRILSRRAKQHK